MQWESFYKARSEGKIIMGGVYFIGSIGTCNEFMFFNSSIYFGIQMIKSSKWALLYLSSTYIIIAITSRDI
jgi:hypothetical protein